MVKCLEQQIKVRCDGRGNPLAFCWRKKWIPVSQILELWRDTGTWWDGEAEKTFYRVAAAGGGLYELYLNTAGRTWFLYKIYD